MRTGHKTRSFAAALAASLFVLAAPRAGALTTRAAHTATLLPTGNVLIAGGINRAGAILNSAEIMNASKDGSFSATANNMSSVRSSHTATTLANGCVLIAGGWNGAAALTSADVYDPATNAFTAVGAMTTARYNHTATLLNNGKVLVCGGYTNLAGAVTNSCELFTPTGSTGAGNCGGGFAATSSLLQARAFHTATLLKDGKVWFAGGRNPAAVATNGWLQTTESYDQATGAFSSRTPLRTARGLHTATVMGDGRVLIAGGFNANNLLANLGILDTLEIFDPVSNSMLPAASLSSRRQNHSAVLSADGSVEFFGGLGNITTTYQDLNTTWSPGSIITLSPTTVPGVANITTPAATFAGGELILSQPVVGTFHDAAVAFSTPSLAFNSGVAYWLPGSSTDVLTGLQANLNGFDAACTTNKLTTCGDVQLNGVPFINFTQGQFFFLQKKALRISGNAITGTTRWTTPNPLVSGSPPSPLDAVTFSTVSATIGFTLDKELGGGTISTGTIALTGGTYTQTSSYTVTLTGGYISIPPGTPIAADGTVSVIVTVASMTGTATWGGSDATSQPSSPMQLPLPGTSVSLSLVGNLVYTASQVDVSNLTTKLGVSTVVVRSMLFGDPEFYDPKHNATSFSPAGGGSISVSSENARYGHTATLLPNNDELIIGGVGCAGAACSAPAAIQNPHGAPGNRLDMEETVQASNFTAAKGILNVARALHTSTLLPDGTILVAGGSNGANVLATAEIYDPATDAFTPTNGNMSVVRDQHTSALLPNGRVLLAGGFTTNTTSTGSTNSADIYYPDTKLFLATSVMVSSRSNHTLTLMKDGNVLAVGGFGPSNVITPSAEIYYSTSGTWGPAAPLPLAGCDGGATGGRILHTATLLKNGKVLVMGGQNSQGVLTSVCAYDPATNSWAAMDSMPHPLYQHTATLMFDGRVLVAGGNDGFGEYNASYFFDPTQAPASQWSSLGPNPLTQPRFGHSAILLPNGAVMISGGTTASGTVPKLLEVFRVNFSSWAIAGSFSAGPRTFHTMTLAADGTVYGIGGSDGVIGGNGSALYAKTEKGYFTADADAFTPNAPPSARQAVIVSTAGSTALQPLQVNTNFNVTGTQFRGGTEASGGGAASANSSFSFPHLVLQQIDGSGGGSSQSNSGFVVDLTTQIYAAIAPSNLATLDTSLTVPLPATTALLPAGWYNARVGANDVYSKGFFVQAGPLKPTGAVTMLAPVVQGISSVTYSWTWPGTGPAPDGYNVYSATTGVFITSIAAAGTSFTQTGLMPNTTTSIVIAGYTMTGDGPLTASATAFTLATAPVNVRITSVTFNTLLLQWDANGNTPGTYYEVSQSTDWPSPFSASVSTPVPSILHTTGNEVAIGQLLMNTTYTFRLRAYNTDGLVSTTFSVQATTATRSSVSGVIGKALDSTSIAWSWNDAGSVTYKVYNATTNAVLISTTATSFVQSGQGVNTIHTIAVSAVTGAGEGPLSALATTYTLANAPGLLNPALTSLTTFSFMLGWGPNGNPPGTPFTVALYEYLDSGINIATFSSTGYTFDTTSLAILKANVRYDAYITAYNGEPVPIASPQLLISTYTLADRPQFVAPVFFTVTPTTIGLKWDTVGNSTHTFYEVTYSTDPAFAVALATAVPFSSRFTGSSTTITGLITSDTYYIRVRAMNLFGQTSQYSFSTNTVTVNGGAPPGSLAGPLLMRSSSELSGNLGDGRFVDLVSPPGAFPGDTTATISPFNVVAGTTLCPGGFNVAVTITDSPGLQPTAPLYLTADYDPVGLGVVPTSQIALARVVDAGTYCVPLATSFFAASPRPRFRAQLNHFSTYQLVQIPLAASAGTVRVFPNPFRAGHDSYVTVDQIPPGARVRIMTMRGETILDQLANSYGMVVWRGTNGAGRSVASGLYIVLVEAGGSMKTTKLAVVR